MIYCGGKFREKNTTKIVFSMDSIQKNKYCLLIYNHNKVHKTLDNIYFHEIKKYIPI